MCYMRTVTHREMRNSSGEILRAVAAGETVQVTNNGRVAAVISPPADATLSALIAVGQARPARRDAVELGSIRRRQSARPSAELIDDARGRW
jgi:prevent-host-death family protein